MATDQEKLAAAEQFVQIWDGLVEGPFDDTAQSLTCTEAESVAELLRVFGRTEAADLFIEAHARGDEEGDSHE